MTAVNADSEVKLVPEEHHHRGGHKAFAVMLGDQKIGSVEHYYPTRERRSKGRVYVNSRWTSKVLHWHYTVVGAYRGFWFETSRKRAVAAVVNTWKAEHQ